jgi:hypothetical protein
VETSSAETALNQEARGCEMDDELMPDELEKGLTPEETEEEEAMQITTTLVVFEHEGFFHD